MLDLLFYIGYYCINFLLISKEIKIKALLWVPASAPPAGTQKSAWPKVSEI